MRRTVIFESRHAGHTIGFAAEFAETFAAAGCSTILVLNGAARGRAQVDEIIGTVPPFAVEWTAPFDAAFASAAQGLRELSELSRIAGRLRPDRLILPTGDAVAQAVPASAEARRMLDTLPRMDIVLHHIAAAQIPRGRASFRRWRTGLAELRALRRHRILTCDAYVGCGPGRWAVALSGTMPVYLPHLLRKRAPWDRQGARAHFGLPPDARILVSTGDVARRKEIHKLTAAARHPDWPADLRLFLAGPAADDMRPEIARLEAECPGRLVLVDRFLSEEEFAAAFLAADIVWAVTPGNIGVSSTFLYAARHDRPAIVAAGHRSARWMCGRIGPGVSTGLAPEAICAALRKAMVCARQSEKQASFLRDITDSSSYERIALST